MLIPYDPSFDPQHRPYHSEDDAHPGEDSDTISSHHPSAELPRVEKVVDVDVRDGVGEIGDTEVEEENEDEEWEMEDGERWSAGEEDLEEGEDCVEGVD